VKGPTAYFWDATEQVLFEEQTVIAPKLETIFDPNGAKYMALGTIVMTSAGETCLLCRSGPGARALIDLKSGTLVKDERSVVAYEHYVLTALDPMQERCVIFDSAAQSAIMANAA
jgi:hypothetical protein